MNNYTIYVDMDGVLCDFLKGASIATGFDLKTPEDWWEVRHTAWKLIAAKGSNFWSNLPWTTDGVELWDFVKMYNPSILSAHPCKEENKNHAIYGKCEWVANELEQFDKIHIVLGIEKQNFAHENAILIDDYDKNIKQFIAKGGIGIQHNNTKSTIKQLKELL